MKGIFLGGPGRSGTTVLRRALGQHPDVATLPGEPRFIVDPGGVLDLYESLTSRWDPYAADNALHRFTQLFSAGGYCWGLLSKYGVQWRGVVGHALKRLKAGLSPVEDASTWVGLPPERRSMYWFSSPQYEAWIILRMFVQDVFGLWNSNTSRFVDDTPNSVLHVDRLRNLFGPSSFILCVRHPFDVLASHLHGNFRWTSRDPRVCAMIIREVFMRSKEHVPDHLRLEDALNAPEETMASVAHVLNLAPGYAEKMAVEYDRDRAHVGRRGELTAHELKVTHGILAPVCKAFGYEVDVG